MAYGTVLIEAPLSDLVGRKILFRRL